MTSPGSLPSFIAPMLAAPGQAFDSDDYLFEIKWDGTRVLAFLEQGSYRLVNRRQVDLTARYPEFAFLANLAPGSVLDGEIVVLRQGKSDFPSLLSREQARSEMRIRNVAKALPATFIAFDVLYDNYRSIMTLPLAARRELLAALVKKCNQPYLLLSEGIVGKGKAFFEEACKHGLEGLIAKRLRSPYTPGDRSDAWIKIKRGQVLLCAIIGFTPSGKNDFRNLIVAAEREGQLQYVGKVGTGFTDPMRTKLNELLRARPRAKPIVPCKIKGTWIEPGLFCRVHCMEITKTGHLRAPAFKGLVDES